MLLFSALSSEPFTLTSDFYIECDFSVEWWWEGFAHLLLWFWRDMSIRWMVVMGQMTQILLHPPWIWMLITLHSWLWSAASVGSFTYLHHNKLWNSQITLPLNLAFFFSLIPFRFYFHFRSIFTIYFCLSACLQLFGYLLICYIFSGQFTKSFMDAY